MEKTLKIPSETNFSVSKVKLVKNGGIDIHYDIIEIIDNEAYINKYHVESTKEQHPDLINCFKSLCLFMLNLYRQSELEFPNIEVRGVSFIGKGDNKGVVITGLFEFENGQKAAINSPLIKFSAESFGFEEELSKKCTTLEAEVYAYLFENKKAQLELFGSDGEPLS